MLDQSFSIKNFRRIFDLENRKGVYLEGKYFPSVSNLSAEIRLANKGIKKLLSVKAKYGADRYRKLYNRLRLRRIALLKKKDVLLDSEFDVIAKSILRKDFKVQLKASVPVSGKATYSYEDNPETFFALKQVQRNIRRTYHVKQRNRHNIVCQLQMVLSDGFPKTLIKLDISSFYESIPRDAILKKLSHDRLLTQTSLKTVSSILGQYEALSSSSIGLPRGIGISAYLSELYMRKFDSHIALDCDLLYYARYVDDIIIVYSDSKEISIESKRHDIEKCLQDLRLSINTSKTQVIRAVPNYNFEYLGYKYSVSGRNLSTSISRKKMKRYKERLALTFEEYKKTNDPYREKISRKLLHQRVKYLTGNTRLANNKKNVCVGIYFSNDRLTDFDCLHTLDDYLASLISTLESPILQAKLQRHSYLKGFTEKRFHRFNAQQLTNIVKAWGHET